MSKLQNLATRLQYYFWLGLAVILKPLMRLLEKIPNLKKPQVWFKLQDKFDQYDEQKLKEYGWIAAGTLAAYLVLLAVLNPGWKTWLEWQTFSGTREDQATTTSTPAPRYDMSIYGVEQLRYNTSDGKPRPITINFQVSAAPLDAIGREAVGVSISPGIAGKWKWITQNRLEFQPEEEWSIDETYKVSLDDKAIAPNIQLSSYSIKFSTPRFEAQVKSSSFYQDPEQVTLRKAVYEIGFSYPVNPESFEKNIRLVGDGASSGFFSGMFGGAKNTRKFTVTYDSDYLTASVQSEALPIPDKSATMTLIVETGVKSQRSGNKLSNEIRRAVEIPGLYNLNVTDARQLIVTGENGEPENVIHLTTSMAVKQSEMERSIKAWLLPLKHPSPDNGEETTVWNSAQEVTEEVLKQATPLTLTAIPSERDANENHGFKFSADPGRYMYMRVAKGMSSVGGYQLGDFRHEIMRVKQFAPELTFMSKGSLLAMSGEKKLPIIVRDLPGVQMEIGRLLPHQLQHLVSQSQGDMVKPQFYSGITPDHLTERFERKIPLNLKRGKTHYETLDFSEYLRQDSSDRRGIFYVTLQGYDPKTDSQNTNYRPQPLRHRNMEEEEYVEEGEGEGGYQEEQENDYQAVSPSSMRESRLVIVTDLGVVSKLMLDGTRNVFVQSIASGQPVSDATVEIWARNGATLVSHTTDGNGKASLPSVNGMSREKTPEVLVVKKGGDVSFMPLNKYGRNLDLSRFDVGGIHTASLPNQIQAFLFSDRGIYRPGDSINVGIITKSTNWAQKLVDMPVEMEVVDARGLVIRRDKLQLGSGGMAEYTHSTQDSSPTGNYTFNLNLARDSGSALPGAPSTPPLRLGSMTVKVQEFMPDRMKVTAALSSESAEGWVSPKELKAMVSVLNLFGTPAMQRRVEGSLTLSPAYPAFKAFRDYTFSDPTRAKEGFNSKLERQETNDQGKAEFDLGLQRYKQATYQVHVLVNAFEPEGGRAVAAETSALVSDRPYLLGYKADGDLNYIDKNSERHVSIIAVNSKAKKTGVNDLRLVKLERKVVSVLVKQSNGLFRYESKPQETVISEDKFKIAEQGNDIQLATQTPGNFAYAVRDAKGLELTRINYSVAGAGNVSRSLDRNAELQMTLSKKDYVPGQDIEISIRAPYTGAGLITIERDKVYAHKWFKTSETASVQRITLPANFEGNGYVSVQFTRDLASKEIYMSPMSYGVMPFETSLSRRTTQMTLKAPDLIKPGQTAKFSLETRAPTRAVVFAVDEGILQVARYQTPDPLKHFFQKRALEVTTQQTLDLILPEFRKLMQGSAPGGDADSPLGKNLNPFKRRTDKPVVFWSGVVAVNGSKEFSYTVPESFNGSLRVMAVAVNDDTMASASTSTTVRGDIVLLPNVPVAITPGDEVEIGIGVANNTRDSGKDAQVKLNLEVTQGLEIVGPATQTLKISERSESSTKFRIKAKAGAQAQLGSASVIFQAQVKEAKARLATDVSVRPASAYVSLVQTGIFRGEALLQSQAEMYPNFKQSEAALSGSPWAFAAGLIKYLDVYPHGCTEQITSQTFPAIVLSNQPGIAEQLQKISGSKKPDPHKTFERYLTQVRARQGSDGGIAMWPGSQSDLFATTYVTSLLLEAKERKFAVPNDMLQRANVYLQTRLAESSAADYNWRVQAQAAYLLARQGVIVTAALNNLHENLRIRIEKAGFSERDAIRADLGAVYLASSYQILKQEKLAQELLQPALKEVAGNTDPWRRWYWNYYYDPLVYRAATMQMIALHFPEQIKQLPMDFWTRMASAIRDNYYQSLSAARILQAVDAYAAAAAQSSAGKVSMAAINKAGKSTALELPAKITLSSIAVPLDANKLKMNNGGELPLFYSWTENGYESNLPKEATSKGIEIIHEFLNDKGSVIKEAKIGDEVTVRVRVRTTDREWLEQVALVDILPGGMEPVLTAPSDTDEPSMPIWRRRLGGSSSWAIDYADIREDRVIFYGNVGKNMTEVTYKVRATNVGEFVVPAAYAEAMYERRIFGRSAADSFKILPAN